MTDTDAIELSLEKLVDKFKGKKLLWISYDEELGGYYLRFEGGEMASCSDIQLITDPNALIKKLLKEHLPSANRIKELETLLPKENSNDSTSASATTAPSEPVSGGNPQASTQSS